MRYRQVPDIFLAKIVLERNEIRTRDNCVAGMKKTVKEKNSYTVRFVEKQKGVLIAIQQW